MAAVKVCHFRASNHNPSPLSGTAGKDYDLSDTENPTSEFFFLEHKNAKAGPR